MSTNYPQKSRILAPNQLSVTIPIFLSGPPHQFDGGTMWWVEDSILHDAVHQYNQDGCHEGIELVHTLTKNAMKHIECTKRCNKKKERKKITTELVVGTL